MKKLTAILILTMLTLAACTNDDNTTTEAATAQSHIQLYITENSPPSTGSIFLYGEQHGCARTMDRQLEIWGDYYHNHGMRHLFIENSYFGAQFLNMWMQADDNTILSQLFEDWRGTAAHIPHTLVFFITIKRDFPETIFHGTDIGHQSDTTGQRFLQYLIENDLQDTESYRLTRENIAQYRRFRDEQSHAVRAYYKPQNFIREFDRLGDESIMAIHGNAHVAFGNFMGYPNVPTMATALRERYGDALHTFDMTQYALMQEPIRMETLTIGGTDFEAAYFGNDGARFNNVIGREFWRLENAYEYFQDNELNGNVLPFDNFPMVVEVGQVYVVDVHFEDGTVMRMFYRASGNYWDNRPTTEEFLVE